MLGDPCKQLEEMEARVLVSNTRLLMDNATLHRAKITQKNLNELEVEWPSHPPYSPDISSLNFCVFRRLKIFYRTRHFKSCKEVEDLDRDQASRLPEEKIRTTARTTENNRENMRKVPR